MNDVLKQLQRDLGAIYKRGAQPIRMQVTPELIRIVEVEYTWFERHTSEPTYEPSIYGVRFDMVTTLPGGLLYSITTDR